MEAVRLGDGPGCSERGWDTPIMLRTSQLAVVILALALTTQDLYRPRWRHPMRRFPPPNLISSMRAEDDESPEGEGHSEDEDNAAKRKIKNTEDEECGMAYQGCGVRRMAETANYLSRMVHDR